EASAPSFDEAWEMLRRGVALKMVEIVTKLDHPIEPGSPEWNVLADRVLEAQGFGRTPTGDISHESETQQDQGETITQASEAWFAEMQRPGAGVRAQTLDGHKLRVRAFVDQCGDVPLSSVTRVMASDFLSAIAKGRSNRTTNNYATTLQCLFKSARNRGRF